MKTMRRLMNLLLLLFLSSPQGGGGQAPSAGVGNELLRIVALGRPFSLGMFYDSRSDTLIPGLTLWDKDTLEKGKTVTPQPNTEFDIVASESVSDKLSSLGVEASLKASFLSGLVSVEGSAKYLKDDRKSSKQARVTLKYKTTTMFKALSMEQLGTGNLEHSEVIDKGLATHVVTGIQYGAQAFFVFNQESSEAESVQDIQGNLKVMVKKIPTISIEGSGSLAISDSEKERVKKFSCTFHGDFRLPSSPTTFEEAVNIYQNLPKFLGEDGENAVPVVVYLLPLSALDTRASKLVRQISLRLVTEAEHLLEGFNELEMWTNDVLTSPAGLNFPHISEKIKHFKALCSEFKLGLQGTLAEKLPLIRGGGEAETALADVLRKASQSPFNLHNLRQWKQDKNDQAEVFKTILKLVKNAEFVSSENALTNKVFDSANTLVFVFTFLRSADPFLSELEQYLRDPQSPSSNTLESRNWFRSRDVITSVILNAQHFGSFAEANKDRDRKNIQFLVLGLTDENNEGSTIHSYVDRVRVSEDFKLPSRPKSLTVGEVSYNSFSLSFSPPSDGVQSISEYRVEYCEIDQDQWNHQHQAEAGTVTVTGLKPNTEYRVRVRANTAVGVGPEAAPEVSVKGKTTVKTLPCSPPENLRGTSSFKDINVHWSRPAQVGEGVHIQNYIVEFGETQNNMLWLKEASQSEEKVITGLQPHTSYTIRVLCDCGEQGTSTASTTITVTTRNIDPGQDDHILLRNTMAQISVLQNEVSTMQTQLQHSRQHLAFSAALASQSGYGHIGPFDGDTTLVFRRLLISISSNMKPTTFSSGYDTGTGIFTAPVTGAYHFEYYCYGEGSPGTHVSLWKNSERVVTANTEHASGWQGTSNGATVSLQAGDRVYLQLKGGYKIYYSEDMHYSTFSGRLLFPE